MSSPRKALRRIMRTENRTTRKLRLSWAAPILIAFVAVVLPGCGGGFSLSSGAPPAVTISPLSGAPGKSLSISISGSWTHFAQGATTAGFGAGVAVGNGASGAVGTVSVTSPTTATAQISIDASAAPGTRDVTVTTGNETIVLAKGFSVLDVPVANAGLPQTVSVGATVQLDGSGSTDPGGLSLTYAWTLVSTPTGSAAVLSSAAAAKPTFVADKAGSYRAQLIVSNGAQSSSAVTVTITCQNLAPVANAGADQNVALAYGNTVVSVTLDGSGSYSASSSIASYSWSGTPTPSAIAKPTLSLAAGSYTFTLTVTDSKGLTSAPVSTHVTVVKETVHPPVITFTTQAPYAGTAGSGTTLSIALRATSPDGRPVTLTAAHRSPTPPSTLRREPRLRAPMASRRTMDSRVTIWSTLPRAIAMG